MSYTPGYSDIFRSISRVHRLQSWTSELFPFSGNQSMRYNTLAQTARSFYIWNRDLYPRSRLDYLPLQSYPDQERVQKEKDHFDHFRSILLNPILLGDYTLGISRETDQCNRL